MSRKHKTSMFNLPLVIVMILSLSLPIATFFLKYMSTKERYNILQAKYESKQKEFEQEVLQKLSQVDTIQRKRKIYDKVNKTLKSRQCTSTEMASKYLKEFVDKISGRKVKIQAKLQEVYRSNLPGYDTILRENIRVKASLQDFWKIMAQITRIGDEAFYCSNKACSEFEVKKIQEELEDVKNCAVCKKPTLIKGVIPVFYYIEKFNLDVKSYKTKKEIDLEFVVAIPIALNNSN